MQRRLPSAQESPKDIGVPDAPQISFSYTRKGELRCGVARIVHFNAAMICFDAEILAPKDCTIEIRVNWPAASEDSRQAELVLRGPVIDQREATGTTTVRVDNYEFQLSGERSFQVKEQRAHTCDFLA